MGLFFKNKSSNRTEEVSGFPWAPLVSNVGLEELIRASYDQPQVIFKHSTSCGISRMVKSNFEKEYLQLPEGIDWYYLDLLSYRGISNAIADQLKIRHESPQLLVIKNGEVVAHASHSDILTINLFEYQN
ncbi:MAG: bacillithiol system redox-active protein YtxJ [Bacteroidetes bacterium]|nr:bacillithiol system redox-active protein YtxJ [Bacteroidota bacterium]MDA0880105.1 bacillithiol system redox-active protein YtxJ [Bacteroidota bacterium]